MHALNHQIFEFFVAQCILVKRVVKCNAFWWKVMNSRSRSTLYISLKSWLCCCSLSTVAPQQQICYFLRRCFPSFCIIKLKVIWELNSVKKYDVSFQLISVPDCYSPSYTRPRFGSFSYCSFSGLRILDFPDAHLKLCQFKDYVKKLLTGSFSIHVTVILVKADWKIVIKRKGVQVMEFGIKIRNWPPSLVIFSIIFSISLLRKRYGLFLTAKLRSHKIWNSSC